MQLAHRPHLKQRYFYMTDEKIAFQKYKCVGPRSKSHLSAEQDK